MDKFADWLDVPDNFVGDCYIQGEEGTFSLTLERLLHNINGPAIVYDNGRKEYWQDGSRHRLDGPAVEDAGIKQYYIKSKNYSEETYWKHSDVMTYKKKTKPALPKAKILDVPKTIASWTKVTNNDAGHLFLEDEETHIYLKKGIIRHREDGPAVVDKQGNKFWWYQNKKHRLDGPAVEYSNGQVEYWIDDSRYITKESYLKKIEELKTMFSPKKPLEETGGLGVPVFEEEEDVPDDFIGCCYIEEYKGYYWLTEFQERHRVDGPAIILDNGHKEWFLNDHPHRVDGPAIERADGVKEFWLNGTKYSEEKYLDHPEVIMAFQKTKAKPKLEHKITVPETKKEELKKVPDDVVRPASDEDIKAVKLLTAETYAKKHGYKFCILGFDAKNFTGKTVDGYGIVSNYVNGLLHDENGTAAITSIHDANIKRYHQYGILHSINVPQSGVLYRSSSFITEKMGAYYSINGMMFKTEQAWKMAILAYEAAKRVVARKITSFAQSHLVSILAGSDIETVNIMAMFMATDKGKLLVNLVSGLIAEQLIDKVPVKYRIPFAELCTEFKIEAMAIGQEMFFDAGLDIIMNLVTSKAHTAIEELTRIDENLEGLPLDFVGEEAYVENHLDCSPESLVV